MTGLVETPFKLTLEESLLSAATTICLLDLERFSTPVQTIEEMCYSPQYGYTASASLTPCGPRLVRITDLRAGIINWQNVPFCRCPNSTSYELFLGDILVARSGSVGKSFIVSAVPELAVFASYLIRLRVKKGVLPEYVYLCLQSQQFWQQIMDFRRGSAMKNINGRMLQALRFPFPEFDLQKHIVDFLGVFLNRLKGESSPLPDLPRPLSGIPRAMARIEELAAKIDEAEGLRKEALLEAEALVDQVATSIFQSPKLRSYLKPIALADMRLNRETRDPARSNPGGEFAYVDISSVSQGPSVVSSAKVLPSNEAPSRARRVIHTDDIIMSTVRPNLRAFAKIGRELNNQICSTGFAVLSCGPSLNPDFLLLQMCSPFFVEQCIAKTTGGHYPAINDTNLKKVYIVSPPLPEQRRIVAELDALQAKVDGLKKLQAETAVELKALLPSVLDRAFKGEL